MIEFSPSQAEGAPVRDPDIGDWIDASATQQQDALNDALAALRRADPTAGKTVADSATHCYCCGDAIPQGRRAAVPGVQNCAECQSEIERAEKRR